MLELLMTFFEETGAVNSAGSDVPHLRHEEFDAAESFIYSLDLTDEERPAPLLH